MPRFPRFLSPLLRWRADLVEALDGSILEIGVGGGANLPYYRGATAVWAIEPDRASVSAAHSKARHASVPVAVNAAAAEHLPFPAASFDHVVSSLVFCSVHDPEQALGEIRRVLRPQGTLHMVEHVRPLSPGLAWLASGITPYWSRVAGNCHLDRPTLETLHRAGWEVDLVIRRAVLVKLRARAL